MRKIFVTTFLVGICQLLSAQTYSLSGVVRNQDGEPVAGAKVSIVDPVDFMEHWKSRYDDFEVIGDTVCTCSTDADGHYSASFSLYSSNYWDACFMAVASADGFPDCRMNGEWYLASETETLDFTLCSKLAYHHGEKATIILPTKPDPAWGQYFRLVGVEQCGTEGSHPVYRTVFEMETEPQANVPYVVIPSCDFLVNTTELDFSSEPGYVSIGQSGCYDEVRFAGTYQSFMMFDLSESEYVYSIGGAPNYMGPQRLEACHAYLVQPWHFKDPVFRNGEQAINSPVPAFGQSASVSIFDLQGRRLDSPPAKGVYIRDGKKVVR